MLYMEVPTDEIGILKALASMESENAAWKLEHLSVISLFDYLPNGMTPDGFAVALKVLQLLKLVDVDEGNNSVGMSLVNFKIKLTEDGRKEIKGGFKRLHGHYESNQRVSCCYASKVPPQDSRCLW